MSKCMNYHNYNMNIKTASLTNNFHFGSFQSPLFSPNNEELVQSLFLSYFMNNFLINLNIHCRLNSSPIATVSAAQHHFMIASMQKSSNQKSLEKGRGSVSSVNSSVHHSSNQKQGIHNLSNQPMFSRQHGIPNMAYYDMSTVSPSKVGKINTGVNGSGWNASNQLRISTQGNQSSSKYETVLTKSPSFAVKNLASNQSSSNLNKFSELELLRQQLIKSPRKVANPSQLACSQLTPQSDQLRLKQTMQAKSIEKTIKPKIDRFVADNNNYDSVEDDQLCYNEEQNDTVNLEDALRMQSQRTSECLNVFISRKDESKYGSSASTDVLKKVIPYVQEKNSKANIMLPQNQQIGLRKNSNNVPHLQVFDKQCSSSQRQTPSSQLVKRQNLKSAQGFQGPNEKITVRVKNEMIPLKEDQVQSVTTSDSSQKTIVKSQPAFIPLQTEPSKPEKKVVYNSQSHFRKQSNTHKLAVDQHHHKRSSKDFRLCDKNSTLTEKLLQSSYEANSTTEDANNVQNNTNRSGTKNAFESDLITQQQYCLQENSCCSVDNQSKQSIYKYYQGSSNKSPMHLQNSVKKQKRKKSSNHQAHAYSGVKKPAVTYGANHSLTPHQATSTQKYLNQDKVPYQQMLIDNHTSQINAFSQQSDARAQQEKVPRQTSQLDHFPKQQVQHQRNSSNNHRIPQTFTISNLMQKRTQQPTKSSFTQGSSGSSNQGLLQKQTGFPVQRTQTTVPIVSNTPKKKANYQLLDSEKQTYGDRVPKGYDKIDLLGKGGCALVWLAKNQKTGEHVALKQFPKSKGQLDQTARVEVNFGRALFPKLPNGKTTFGLDPQIYPGIKSIAKLIDDIEETKDYWLVYEVGSHSLSKHLYEVKGEFFKGERIYHVQHQTFFQDLKVNSELMKDLIKKIAETFVVLTEVNIVHADIKPDNILVDYDGSMIKDIKLIDFGSAFSYENPSNIQASTPEYLAPEVLEYLENRAQNTQANGTNSGNLCRRQQPWSYDIWSLGALLLEILTGFPLWLSLKSRVTTPQGKSIIGMGLFGVQGREGKKILIKQQQLLKNVQISQTLKKYDCYGYERDHEFMDLLQRMLDFNPMRRISPQEILQHPFIVGTD